MSRSPELIDTIATVDSVTFAHANVVSPLNFLTVKAYPTTCSR